MKTQKISSLISLFLCFGACLAIPSVSRGNEIDLLLGNADDFGVLSLSGGITMSGGSLDGGNAGVASAGQQLLMSGGARVTGFADINTGSAFNRSGGAKVVGGVNQNAGTNTFLQSAAANAYSASATAASMPGPSIVIPDKNFTISEAVVGNYVFHLTNLQLSGSHALTLSAPTGSTFTLDISGNFTLSGSSSVDVSGGLTARDVLLNVTGPGSLVNLSGGTTVDGTILAPNRTVNVNGGALVNGRVIAQNIILSGGVKVVSPEF